METALPQGTASAAEWLKRMVEQGYDAVISDGEISEMNGIDLLTIPSAVTDTPSRSPS